MVNMTNNGQYTFMNDQDISDTWRKGWRWGFFWGVMTLFTLLGLGIILGIDDF